MMKISVKSMDAVSKSPMSLTKEIVIKRPIPDSKTFEEEPTSVVSFRFELILRFRK